jgi:hypothetical protein
MERFAMRSMLAAAVLALAAGSASAQTMTAEIPFTFQVGEAVMPPGTYFVIASQNTGSRHLVFRKADTKESALAQYSMGDVSKAWQSRGTPLVRFECSGARCALRELWAGYGMPAFNFRGPRLGPDGEVRMAVIGMSVIKSD